MMFLMGCQPGTYLGGLFAGQGPTSFCWKFLEIHQSQAIITNSITKIAPKKNLRAFNSSQVELSTNHHRTSRRAHYLNFSTAQPGIDRKQSCHKRPSRHGGSVDFRQNCFSTKRCGEEKTWSVALVTSRVCSFCQCSPDQPTSDFSSEQNGKASAINANPTCLLHATKAKSRAFPFSLVPLGMRVGH